MTIGQAFNQTATYYDEWVRVAIPHYDEVFSIAKALIPFPTKAPIRVLDLGAGTGLFSWHVMQKYPQAHFVLHDLAEQMLNVAKERFSATPGRVEFRIGDYRTLQGEQAFDLVISSLSIHHLTDEEKQKMFGDIYNILRTPGIFINIDQIKAPSPTLKDGYWNAWLDNVRRNGASEERIRQSIERRTTYDKDALLIDQLVWLRTAGFESADCIYKHYFIGIFFAIKQ
jgi:tRNA (cmo5U34)-methyltransferase